MTRRQLPAGRRGNDIPVGARRAFSTAMHAMPKRKPDGRRGLQR